ncbi:hypothetical protein B4U79_17887 [Dinothrombium tinctorium]|uniref:Thyroglobulin type-1 domain-containing protein n=1 Tax=Dinothrombium tinctorium TaxID=1965070 RepID=A0A3S5WGZ7_9ACAR|nr:hypothetical protein B4U79_18157 [Dinothrombium tinctorium]RWS16064.1 hypothetical protein B4U79_17888 [Dinothrombium tinctorium]RWS16077.1 hypothetical protein B4U79_17887 [Dinothrombium tinctorium]
MHLLLKAIILALYWNCIFARWLQNCMSRYEEANLMREEGVQDVVLPNCDSNGNYKQVQYHPLIGYFCVNKITGESIGRPEPAPDLLDC